MAMSVFLQKLSEGRSPAQVEHRYARGQKAPDPLERDQIASIVPRFPDVDPSEEIDYVRALRVRGSQRRGGHQMIRTLSHPEGR